MGVLDKIDFSFKSSVDSSIDFRLLDAPCDHFVRNEAPVFDINDIVAPAPYSGLVYNSFNYGAELDPNASITFTTKLPYVNDGSFVVYEKIIDTTVEVSEEFEVPENYNDFFLLQFPPMTNTVTAKQKVYVDGTNYKLIDFTRYELAQLYGNVRFTDENDIGETIIFTYLPDKRIISEKNLDQTINYEYLGLNQNGYGIFKIYGRAFHSTRSKILIKYRTQSSSCQKCGGKNEINDIVFDQSGRIQLTYDFSKLIQDFFKRLLTEKGSNPFDLNEGTDMMKMTGIGKRNPMLIDTLVKNEIVNLLNTIRAKQGLQKDIQGIGLGEQIYQISNVYVQSINATDIQVEIEVLSQSGLTGQIKAVVRR